MKTSLKCGIDKLNPIFGKMSPLLDKGELTAFKGCSRHCSARLPPKSPLPYMHCTLILSTALHSNPSSGSHWALDAEADTVQCKQWPSSPPFGLHNPQWARAAARTCLHCHLTEQIRSQSVNPPQNMKNRVKFYDTLWKHVKHTNWNGRLPNDADF